MSDKLESSWVTEQVQRRFTWLTSRGWLRNPTFYILQALLICWILLSVWVRNFFRWLPFALFRHNTSHKTQYYEMNDILGHPAYTNQHWGNEGRSRKCRFLSIQSKKRRPRLHFFRWENLDQFWGRWILKRLVFGLLVVEQKWLDDYIVSVGSRNRRWWWRLSEPLLFLV